MSGRLSGRCSISRRRREVGASGQKGAEPGAKARGQVGWCSRSRGESRRARGQRRQQQHRQQQEGEGGEEGEGEAAAVPPARSARCPRLAPASFPPRSRRSSCLVSASSCCLLLPLVAVEGEGEAAALPPAPSARCPRLAPASLPPRSRLAPASFPPRSRSFSPRSRLVLASLPPRSRRSSCLRTPGGLCIVGEWALPRRGQLAGAPRVRAGMTRQG
eukprot:COSAG05_NODE_6910_length_882_cov_606.561941_1_plen_217_part_00